MLLSRLDGLKRKEKSKNVCRLFKMVKTQTIIQNRMSKTRTTRIITARIMDSTVCRLTELESNLSPMLMGSSGPAGGLYFGTPISQGITIYKMKTTSLTSETSTRNLPGDSFFGFSSFRASSILTCKASLLLQVLVVLEVLVDRCS